jgi:cytoskeletal protein CcmA (bactofilin family)
MFSKDSKTPAKSSSNDGKDRVPSIISPSLRVVGDLISDGDVQVDGIIEGDVSARSVTISEGATIKGQITAEKVLIRGEVHGQITADSVEFGRSARVIGDVVHNDLSIERGAYLEGQCRRKERSALPAQITSSVKEPDDDRLVING